MGWIIKNYCVCQCHPLIVCTLIPLLFLEKHDKIAMGLQFKNRDLSSLLYVGVITESFRSSRKIPVENDWLKILVNGCLIDGAISRNTFGLNESKTNDLLGFKPSDSFSTSSSVTGSIKKLSQLYVLPRNDLNEVFTDGILIARLGHTFVKYSLNLFAVFIKGTQSADSHAH